MTEHHLILTGTWPRIPHAGASRAGQTQGNGLTVRCSCMADKRAQTPYAFDFLVRGVDLDTAKAVYREHVETGATLFPHHLNSSTLVSKESGGPE